jgi:hypothetical protein
MPRVIAGPVDVYVYNATDYYPVLGQLETGAEVPVVGNLTDTRDGVVETWLAIPNIGYLRYDPAAISLNVDLDDLPRRSAGPAPLHPAARRTGVEAIDEFLDAIAAGDAAWLEAHLALQIDETTGVEGFPVIKQSGTAHVPLEEMASVLQSWIRVDWRLYAVVDLEPDLGMPGRHWYVVLSPPSRAFYITPDGRIAAILTVPDDTPGALLNLFLIGQTPTYVVTPYVPLPLVSLFD